MHTRKTNRSDIPLAALSAFFSLRQISSLSVVKIDIIKSTCYRCNFLLLLRSLSKKIREFKNKLILYILPQ